jgi:hypothetical protein
MMLFRHCKGGAGARKVFVEDHALCYYAGYPGGGTLQYLVLLESSQASYNLVRAALGKGFGSAR